MSGVDYILGTNDFVDLSKADFSEITPAGNPQLASVVDRVYKSYNLGTAKVAVYAANLLPAALSSLYSDVADSSVEHIRVFKDREEAENWLQRDKV